MISHPKRNVVTFPAVSVQDTTNVDWRYAAGACRPEGEDRVLHRLSWTIGIEARPRQRLYPQQGEAARHHRYEYSKH